MTEEFPRENNGSVGDRLDDQYRHTALNYKLRWEVYKYAEPYVDFHYQAAVRAQLSGDEKILDVGCGDGSFLFETMHAQLQHRGQMTGVDKNPAQFEAIRSFDSAESQNIFLKPMAAENLQFDDDSFDAAFSLFTLYHTDEPRQALSELKRVVKPEGKIMITTSGPVNKIAHRYFETKMAGWMTEEIKRHPERIHPNTLAQLGTNQDNWQIHPPAIMNVRFDGKVADNLLPELFEIQERFPANSVPQIIRITPDTEEIYLNSLRSMQSAFDPWPPINLLNASINAVVKPELQAAYDNEGEYTDIAQRMLYVCVNRK